MKYHNPGNKSIFKGPILTISSIIYRSQKQELVFSPPQFKDTIKLKEKNSILLLLWEMEVTTIFTTTI